MIMKTYLLPTICFTIVLGCSGLMFYPLLTSEVKPWEQGREIPVTPPEESRRVTSVHGFSIVIPPNWDHSVSMLPEAILMRPRRSIAGRCGFMQVQLIGTDQPPLDGYQRTTFQNLPAYERLIIEPSTLDERATTTYDILLQREGTWYQLAWVGMVHIDEPPPMVATYLETLQVEP